jgi:hypothetical protein
MFPSILLNSPAAEKRVVLSLLRKQLIGRRAYSDSVYFRKTKTIHSPPTSTSPSIASSVSSSPRHELTSAELARLAVEISAC